jgi:hypothetical protein
MEGEEKGFNSSFRLHIVYINKYELGDKYANLLILMEPTDGFEPPTR